MRSFSLVLILLSATLASADDQPEPRFRGKPLDFWIGRMRSAETSQDLDEAVTAVKAFEKDGLPRLRSFEVMLDDRSAPFRSAAGSILESFGADAQPILPGLLKALKDGTCRDPGVVLKVVGAMGPAGKEAVPVLVGMLKAKDRDTMFTVVRALAHIGPEAKEAVPAIFAAIRDHRASSRNDDAYYYDLIDTGRLGEAAVPSLAGYLEDKGEMYRRQALVELAQVGPAAKPVLEKMKALQKDTLPPFTRLEAAKAVWAVGRDDAALATLKELMAKTPIRDRTTRGGPTDFYDSVAYQAAMAAVALGADAKPLLPELKALAETMDGQGAYRFGGRMTNLDEEVRAIETDTPPARRLRREADSYPRRTPASTGAAPGRGGRGD